MQAAKAAAATIRSFQPAIQEISQASSEIRTTITNEMGIDKLQNEFREIQQTTRDSFSLNPTLATTANANKTETAALDDAATASTDKAAARTDVLDTVPQELESFESRVAKAQNGASDEDPDIERKRAESAALAWGGADAVPSAADGTPADTGGPRRLEDMSMAELERELDRRKKLIKAIEDLNA